MNHLLIPLYERTRQISPFLQEMALFKKFMDFKRIILNIRAIVTGGIEYVTLPELIDVRFEWVGLLVTRNHT